jgi:hypothetical protein
MYSQEPVHLLVIVPDALPNAFALLSQFVAVRSSPFNEILVPSFATQVLAQ